MEAFRSQIDQGVFGVRISSLCKLGAYLPIRAIDNSHDKLRLFV